MSKAASLVLNETALNLACRSLDPEKQHISQCVLFHEINYCHLLLPCFLKTKKKKKKRETA
jgi:hypothetical protein